MTKRLVLAVVSVLPVLAGSAVADNIGLSVTVTVNTYRSGPDIDRNIFGQFSEHLGRRIYDGIWVGEDSAIPNIRGYLPPRGK